MSDNYKGGRGLDVGTSYIIASRALENDDKIQYTQFRDAFYRMKPSSPIAKKMMEKGLKGQQYFEDVDNSFVVVGQDAIERAIERNESAQRPLARGVISPKEKHARRILRHIFKDILGPPAFEGERLVYSVPAQPIDQDAEDFDVGWHTDALNNDLKALGYSSEPINEAEAICYSELEDNDYSGFCFSFGAGAVNFCLMSSGEAILRACITRCGDWIDRMAAQATASMDTVVQVEKEQSKFTIGQEVTGNPILSAVSLYYVRLIDYCIKNVVHLVCNTNKLPKFSSPIPIVIAGGTSLANGFVEEFKRNIDAYKDGLPFEIKEIRPAKDQLRAVSKGCLIAANL